MSYVRIKKSPTYSGRLEVTAPYNPDLVIVMQKLGGKFEGNAWSFDPRDEDTVRNACREIYGTDGDDNPPLVDVRLHFVSRVIEEREGLVIMGRHLAKAYGRDTGASLGFGVVVVSGSMPTSGGSMKNWTTVIPKDTVLEVRDVPRAAFDKLVSDPPDWVEAEIVREHAGDRAKLEEERARLEERIKAIDEMLEGMSDD